MPKVRKRQAKSKRPLGRPRKVEQANRPARVERIPEEERLLTAFDVCRWLRVTPLTVYRWHTSKKLKVVKLGGRSLRFRREDIEKFIERWRA